MLQNKFFRQIDKLFPIILIWFIVLFALYSVVSRFTLIRLGIEGYPNTIIYVGLTSVGVLLSLYGFFRNIKDILHKRNLLFLMFFGIVILSALWNYRYDFSGNIKVIMILFTHFILFYSVSLFLTKEQIVKCLKRLFMIINFIWTGASAASLLLYLFNIKYPLRYIEDKTIRQGFVQGRLFGLFADPNFAAFVSLLILFGLVYILMVRISSKFLRISIYISIGIHTLYLILSNSRTVFIAAFAGVITFVLLHTKRKDGKMTKKRIVTRLSATILAVLTIYFSLFGIMSFSAYLISPNRSVREFIRNDMNMDNISNNRFTIWSHYLTLYKDKPVLGTSPRGALPYAEELEPDGYLSETRYETHNGFLSLLVTTGTTGFTVMLVLFIRHILRIKKLVLASGTLNHENILCITFLLMILIFTFFFTNIFFTNNLETMLLWLSLGALKFSV